MERNGFIIFVIVCVIIALYGIITYQWLLACVLIALFLLVLAGREVYEKLTSIQQNVEKIEQHLDEMRKSKP